MSVSSESEGDLPGELAVAGVDAVDDTAAGALLAALLESRGGGNQKQDQTKSRLHSDFELVFRFATKTLKIKLDGSLFILNKSIVISS